MTLHHMTKAQLIKKIELDQASVKRASTFLKDLEDLRSKISSLQEALEQEKSRPPEIKEVPYEVIKEVPYEVVKEVPYEVIKEVPYEVVKEVPYEVIKEVPYEVVKEVEVIKEVLPSWVDPEALKVFQQIRGL